MNSIRTTPLAHSGRPRLRHTVAIVLLTLAWLIPGVSWGEPDRHAAVAPGVPDRLENRPRMDRSAHGDRIGFAWPVEGSVVSRFGRRGLWGWHRGVDIKAPRGAPIHAAAAGIVVFSGRQSSYGRVIKIAHPNGLVTIYAHNSANFVKAGDRVKGGALIGAVGRTGHATTNHLHFEVRRQGVAHDPLTLLQRAAPASQSRDRVAERTPRRHS
jgi:murein DD-endopeptidase MepM/ murein hydrolase activator NlpD